MHCPHFEAHRCRSCTALPVPHAEQVAGKMARCRALLAGHADLAWEAPWTGPVAGFRNKAKMAVGGTVEAPTLGILDAEGQGTDLADCLLYPPELQAAFAPLRDFITRAGLVPYDIVARRGELKYLLLTRSPTGLLMLRLVLRSTESLSRIAKHLPWLHEALPGLHVVSANLQPLPAAVLEGPEEVLLGEHGWLPMPVNDVPLRLGPRSFFQTRTDAAAALYRQAADWADGVAPRVVWDLYCGVGGFALHLAAPAREVVGIERSEAAVGFAADAAAEMGVAARFVTGDATAEVVAGLPAPDLVVVNPPRRGIGESLARWIDAGEARAVVYSSCNPETLARDVGVMSRFRATRGRVFDMFPHTGHLEVLVLLERC